LQTVSGLFEDKMGTENVAWLLYALTRMTRPRRALEVGLGYTTPFLLQALADNDRESENDSAVRRDPAARPQRARLLVQHPADPRHDPLLIGIDDAERPRLVEAVQRLGLESYLRIRIGDFRGMAARLEPEVLPLDLVWFDAGGPREYVDFLREWWELINPDGGLLVLHFTHWEYVLQLPRPGATPLERRRIMPGLVLNEIKRQLALAGISSKFEVLSVVEPHKRRQGSVTLLRRVRGLSMTRDVPIDVEAAQLGFNPAEIRFTLE
jgi:hypothetical protein